MNELQLRVEERAATWGISVERVVHATSSVVAFGRRDRQPVALKIVKQPGDEWLSGQILHAFGGRGMVLALEHSDGAVLLERAMPGTLLAEEDIGDDEATAIIADLIGRMSPGPPPRTAPTIESWGRSFERHTQLAIAGIPQSLVDAAHRAYVELCASQATPRLLHGDLHHHNVLLDERRGWLAIDPKGVVGEPAYEVGAAMRNPLEQPGLFAAPDVIRRRAGQYARALQLDPGRILAWAFAQAVLAAIWELEDDGVLSAGRGWLALATSIGSMLEGRVDV